jgi:hypothetical protein
LWLGSRFVLTGVIESDALQLLHDHLIGKLIGLDRILLEFALLLREAIAAYFLFPIDTLQAQGPVAWLELGEGCVIRNIVWDVWEICRL